MVRLLSGIARFVRAVPLLVSLFGGTPPAAAQDFGTRLVGTGWSLDYNLPLRDITPRNCRCEIEVKQLSFRPVGSKSRDLRVNRFGGGVIRQGRGANVSMQFGYQPKARASSTYELKVRGRCNCDQHGSVQRTIRVRGRAEAIDWRVHRTQPFTPKKNGDFHLRVEGWVPTTIRHDFSVRSARCTLRWSTTRDARGIVRSMAPLMEFDTRVGRRRSRVTYSTTTPRVTVTGNSFDAKVPQQNPNYPPADANYLVLTVDEGNREAERFETNNIAGYQTTFRGIEDIEGRLVKMGHAYAARIQREWKAGKAFYALRQQPDLRLRPFVVPWSWLHGQPNIKEYVTRRFQRVSGIESRAGKAALVKELRTLVRKNRGRVPLPFGTSRRWRTIYAQQTQLEKFTHLRLGGTAERDSLLGRFAIYGAPRGTVTRDRGRYRFEYDGTSVVMLDNFSFADERIKAGTGSFLGVWRTRFSRFQRIYDQDYLLWQRLVGRGEDRLVVTKPVWLPLENRKNQRITRAFRFRG